MQSLPLALVLCSSAFAQLPVQDAVNAAVNTQANIPDVQPIVAAGAVTETFKGDETITINGQPYKVVYDSRVTANGRLNFTSYDNMMAEGALMTTGTLIIDSFGKVGYYLAMNGRVKYVNNILNAEGAIHAVGDMGDDRLNIGAAGFLTCHRSNMTCTRVEGSYDVNILSNWLKYASTGNVKGVASVVDGNAVWSGSVTNQNGGSYKWEGDKIVYVPADDKTDSKSTATKSSSTTTTAAKKPTSTDTSSAMTVGTSMMAVVAGIASFFF